MHNRSLSLELLSMLGGMLFSTFLLLYHWFFILDKKVKKKKSWKSISYQMLVFLPCTWEWMAFGIYYHIFCLLQSLVPILMGSTTWCFFILIYFGPSPQTDWTSLNLSLLLPTISSLAYFFFIEGPSAWIQKLS